MTLRSMSIVVAAGTAPQRVATMDRRRREVVIMVKEKRLSGTTMLVRPAKKSQSELERARKYFGITQY